MSPEDLRQQNDELLKAVRPWSQRAFPFVYLNARYPEFCLREFDRCVRDGPMVGIKFLTGEPASSPRLDPIVERAAAVNAVIFQHTWLKTGGNLPGESTPQDMAALAARHPTVPMICGHTGGNWELASARCGPSGIFRSTWPAPIPPRATPKWPSARRARNA
jgi:predicted TIM-barrel fold metal-dependent hydrolase